MHHVGATEGKKNLGQALAGLPIVLEAVPEREHLHDHSDRAQEEEAQNAQGGEQGQCAS